MHKHSIQFYENDTFLARSVCEFISPALLAGDSAIIIATPAHRNAIEKLLVQNASTNGVTHPDSSGTLLSLDADETLSKFMVDGWPDRTLFKDLLGDTITQVSKNRTLRVRAFGEMVALLCAQGQVEAALRLEELWGDLSDFHAFSLLCAYPMHLFQSEGQTQRFHAICAAHPHVIPSETDEEIPASPEKLHHTIAKLQQKARALEFEVERHKQAGQVLSNLAAHQERIKEEECKRIAREVHDELGGLLTGIKAYVSVVIERAASAGAAPDKLLDEASQLADDAIDTMRRVIGDLRPSVLDQLGVWSALEWYATQIEERTKLSCECRIHETAAAIETDPERSTMLFRIVQETLTNVIRHAGASSVTIRAIRRGDFIEVEIQDNGKGIDTERLLDRESWGIQGMYERVRPFGGELKIVGMPGLGTNVTLRLPMEIGHVQ
ncbi:MAG: MEDS domain-containing protein [Pseudomonadota bacterium]